MARIDAAAITPERQWVTPADIVDAAVQPTPAARRRPHAADRADAETEVELDPRLTSSALAHLLENAARYSPPTRRSTISGWVDRRRRAA